jgi:putative chitobiose transport system substrate-binding protein
VKRLQAILYTQLQRAMLGQISSDAALAEAERQWNAYAAGRFSLKPSQPGAAPTGVERKP